MSKFGDAFKAARKKFEGSGSPTDYVFEFNGKKYSILKKGETKSGVMKKFKGVSRSLTPKLRPNTEKPLTQKQKDAIRDAQKRKAKPGGTAVSPRTGVGGGKFAGKGAGKDKPMDKGVQVPRADPPKGKPRNPRDNQSQSMKGMTEREKFILKTKMSKKAYDDEVAKIDAQLNKKRDAKKVLAALDQQGPDQSTQSYKAGKPRDPKDNQRQQKGMSLRDEALLRRQARKLEAEKATKRRLKKEDTKNANLIQRDSESRRRSGQTNMTTPSKPQISAAARGKLDNEYERPQRVGKDAPRGRMLADDYYDAYNPGGSVPAKKPMVMKDGKKIPAYAADGIGKMNKGGMTKKSGYMGGGMAKKKSGYMGGGMTKKKGVMTYNMGGMVKSQVNNLKGKK